MDIANVIAAVSAGLQAIQTWAAFRDQTRTVNVASAQYETALSSPATQTEAQTLARLIPSSVLEEIERRANGCWARYRDVLSQPSLPDQIDDAEEKLKKCICREIRRVYDLNKQNVPPGKLRDWWEAYCRP